VPDGRRNNGGHSTKGRAGRPSKAEEQKLIEKLGPIEPEALKQLKKAVKTGEPWAIKMFFEYMYGKPKQTTEVSGEMSHQVTMISFYDGDD